MKKLTVLLLLLMGFNLAFAQVSLKRTLSERRHQIVCVAYSPDSRLIATGGFDNSILVRDATTGSITQKLTGLRGFPLSLTFSHDSRYVISGGKDSRVTIWDVSTGAQVRTIRAHSNDVTDVAIRSDNSIVSASKDRSIKLWDFNGNLIRELSGHSRDVMAIDISHDGQRLVSGSADGTVREWDWNTGAQLRVIDAHEGWVRTVAYNHNATLIASGGDDGKINIWNRSNGQLQNSIIAHSRWLETLSFSPDGRYIVSGGHDNYLVVVNANTGQIVFNSPRQNYYVLSTAFAPSGNQLISSVLNSTDLSIWDVSGLAIRADVASPTSSRKATIEWRTPNNQQTENLTYRINAAINSDTPLSSVDVYLNDVRFASHLNIKQESFPLNLDFDQVVYLNEGNNEVKLVAYNNAGETTSETIRIIYSQPKKVQEVVAIQEDKPGLEPKAEPVTLVQGASTVTVSPPVGESAPTSTLEEKTDIPSTELLTADLPSNPKNASRFALIIGNEDYSSYQTGLETEADVAYAINDATAFREYARSILGVPDDNIIFLTNARAIEMHNAVSMLNPIIRALNGRAEIFFYYAGHGFPDEKTREPFLIPVDVSGTNLRFAISIRELYQSLAEHPSSRITIFLDACFSGGARDQGLVSARAVRVQPRADRLQGNLVVFSASSGNESSLPYRDKQHGLFTYYLLQKIKDTQGDITYKELSEYLSTQVGVRSVMVNNKPQTPQTNVSFDVENVWGEWKLK